MRKSLYAVLLFAFASLFSAAPSFAQCANEYQCNGNPYPALAADAVVTPVAAPASVAKTRPGLLDAGGALQLFMYPATCPVTSESELMRKCYVSAAGLPAKTTWDKLIAHDRDQARKVNAARRGLPLSATLADIKRYDDAKLREAATAKDIQLYDYEAKMRELADQAKLLPVAVLSKIRDAIIDAVDY